MYFEDWILQRYVRLCWGVSLWWPAVSWFVFSILGGRMEMANSHLQKIICGAATSAGCYWITRIIVLCAIKRNWNNKTRQSFPGTQGLATCPRTMLSAEVYISLQINTVGFLDQNEVAKSQMLNKRATVSLLFCCTIGHVVLGHLTNFISEVGKTRAYVPKEETAADV